MAENGPSSRAPGAHPSLPSESTAPAKLGDLACEIQSRVRQLAALMMGIDEAIEIPTPDEGSRESLGRAVSLIHLHMEIVPKVLEMAEEIERRTIGREA